MSFVRFPKNDKKFKWTQHIKDKMLFYGISEQKLKTILNKPDRKEEGIAEGTLAVMKRNDTAKRQQEIWLMYAVGKGVKTMISAWRYPGKTKPGKQLPIPDDVLMEIKEFWFEGKK